MKRSFEAFAIINPYGAFWCNDTFEDVASAQAFLDKEFPKHGPNFYAAPVVVEISRMIEKEATFKPAIELGDLK